MAALNPRARRSRGPRMDNVLKDGDFAQMNNWGHVEAAGDNAEPPRWTRTTSDGSGDEGFAKQLLTFGGIGWSIPYYVMLHAILLAWLPAFAPATALAGTCLVVSLALRGHSPDDTRYAGLRAALQLTAFAILLVRFATEITFGFEANAWALIFKLPDSIRLWGDLDPVLRLLLADPVGLYMACTLAYDLWIPHRITSSVLGGDFWTRYNAPPPVQHDARHGGFGLEYLPVLLLAPPLTRTDACYALSLGLFVSFLASYVLSVEVADILSVRRHRPMRRAEWFGGFSDRRYQTLIAIGHGLPMLLVPFIGGIVAILFSGFGPHARLLPLITVMLACTIVCPQHLALSWKAVAIFTTYPGNQHPRAGVHDITPIVRDPVIRARLLRFAALAWIPFVQFCLTDLLPGLPGFDGWAIVWPDLRLKTALIGMGLLVFAPPQLVCGVLRCAYGHILGRFAQGEKVR